MDDDKRRRPLVARDVCIEEYLAEDDEERIIRIFDDPYLSGVYESLTDEIKKKPGDEKDHE